MREQGILTMSLTCQELGLRSNKIGFSMSTSRQIVRVVKGKLVGCRNIGRFQIQLDLIMVIKTNCRTDGNNSTFTYEFHRELLQSQMV